MAKATKAPGKIIPKSDTGKPSKNKPKNTPKSGKKPSAKKPVKAKKGKKPAKLKKLPPMPKKKDFPATRPIYVYHPLRKYIQLKYAQVLLRNKFNDYLNEDGTLTVKGFKVNSVMKEVVANLIWEEMPADVTVLAWDYIKNAPPTPNFHLEMTALNNNLIWVVRNTDLRKFVQSWVLVSTDPKAVAEASKHFKQYAPILPHEIFTYWYFFWNLSADSYRKREIYEHAVFPAKSFHMYIAKLQSDIMRENTVVHPTTKEAIPWTIMADKAAVQTNEGDYGTTVPMKSYTDMTDLLGNPNPIRIFNSLGIGKLIGAENIEDNITTALHGLMSQVVQAIKDATGYEATGYKDIIKSAKNLSDMIVDLNIPLPDKVTTFTPNTMVIDESRKEAGLDDPLQIAAEAGKA